MDIIDDFFEVLSGFSFVDSIFVKVIKVLKRSKVNFKLKNLFIDDE